MGRQRPPSERHDLQVEELSRQYERASAVAVLILASAASGAATPGALNLARQAFQELLVALLGASLLWARLNVPVVYRGGVEDAIRVIDGPSQDELRRRADEAMRSTEHRQAVETLAQTLSDDLRATVGQMAQDADDALREIRRRNVAKAIEQGSPLSARDDFAREMHERGIKYRDKSGRRWQPEAIAALTLRTRVAEILNAGHLNRALEMGSSYVRVFDGDGGRTDEPCEIANGQVWSVSFAAVHPLAHPNCRRSFAGMDPDYSGRVDREAEEARVA